MKNDDQPYLYSILVFLLICFLFLAFLTSKVINIQNYYIADREEHWSLYLKMNEVIEKTNRLEEWVINIENRIDTYHERGPIGVEPDPIEPFPLTALPNEAEQPSP